MYCYFFILFIFSKISNKKINDCFLQQSIESFDGYDARYNTSYSMEKMKKIKKEVLMYSRYYDLLQILEDTNVSENCKLKIIQEKMNSKVKTQNIFKNIKNFHGF